MLSYKIINYRMNFNNSYLSHFNNLDFFIFQTLKTLINTQLKPLLYQNLKRVYSSNTMANQQELAIRTLWRSVDAVCFDVDSTVCRDEAIDELAKFAGKEKEVMEM